VYVWKDLEPEATRGSKRTREAYNHSDGREEEEADLGERPGKKGKAGEHEQVEAEKEVVVVEEANKPVRGGTRKRDQAALSDDGSSVSGGATKRTRHE
jgi:hypothetical protein